MKFFKVTMTAKEVMPKVRKYDDETGKDLASLCRNTEEEVKTGVRMFLYLRSTARLNFVAFAETRKKIADFADRIKNGIDFEIASLNIEEIPCDDFVDRLSESSRVDYCDYDDVMEETGLDKLYYNNHSYVPFEDKFAKKVSDKYLFSKSYKDEIGRIMMGNSGKSIKGHPVHYIIGSDNEKNGHGMLNNIICSLEKTGRISTNRYAELHISYHRMNSDKEDALDMLYKINAGGTVALFFDKDDFDDKSREFSHGVEGYLTAVNKAAEKYMNSVLTVIFLPGNSERLPKIIKNYFPSLAFVTINEEVMDYDACKAYLKHLAKADNMTAEKILLSQIEQNSSHYMKELDVIYAHWYQKKITTVCFPQYAQFGISANTVEKEDANGDSYQELMSMIGLKEAKKVINEALDYFKARKLFRENGFIEDKPSMHMVFTGSPGTAKTSVARLVAGILRDNDILENGHIVECGRSDLVGEFVGHTAPKVKEKFQQAKGGVLFIDEAYSLVDDRHGLFGDEAINTIVQEMENNRDDTIVIFAGYTDEMEKFLNQNPGLRSRIAFHVPFADYNAEELYQISELIANKNGMTFSAGVKEKLLPIMEAASKQNDFGNGRFARNMVEKARMKQAGRLIHSGAEFITKDMMSRFVADDFEMPATISKSNEVKKAIGF